MSRYSLRLVVGALALALLAACSQPPSEPQPYSATGTIFGHEGAPYQPIAASLLLVDTSVALSSASLTEVESGVYLGDLTSIGSDGELTVVFPEGDELPNALLKPPGSLLYNPFGLSCTFSVSDASARVVPVGAIGPIFFPGVFIYTLAGLTPTVALASESTWPPVTPAELAGIRFQTWTYADKPVSVQTDPEVCGDASDPPVLSLEVDLQAGWNQLEWVYVMDGDDPVGFHVQNSTASELYFYVGGIF